MIARSLAETTVALHAALSAAPGVSEALGGAHFYDAVPQKTAYPYAVLGDNVGRDWSGSVHQGAEMQWQIDVFSRKRGRSEALAIAGAIETAIPDLDPQLDGLRIVDLRVTRVETVRLRDGRTFRARIGLRGLIETV